MAVDIRVSGDNSGAIVVGDHNTVIINNPAGAVVLRESTVRVSRRAGPPGLQPRPFANLIDRTQECDELRASLRATPPVNCDVHGAHGSGKSVLLRHACTETAVASAFDDGVLYLHAASNTVEDLLQQIFDALFEADRPFKPSQVQLRTHLAGTFALAVLDEFTGTRKDFEQISNLAATTTFALSSESAVIDSEGRAIHLGGLPIADAVALLGRELQRPIEATEIMSARALCASFDGNPADIILLAAQARRQSTSLQDLANQLRSAESPRNWLQERIVGALTDSEKKRLAAFATVDGEPLEPADVAGISGERIDSGDLDRLREDGLLRDEGKRYRLSGGVAATIGASLLALLPAPAAAQYFAATTATMPAAALVEGSGTILAAMRHAAQSSDSQSVLALAHRAGDAVALAGRWDRWHEMLECALTSARSVNDRAGEAWALHQLGSRALAIGDVAIAERALEAALHIRSQLADVDAIDVTKHNLGILHFPSDLAPKPSKPAPGPLRVRSGVVIVLLILLAAGSIAGIAATIYRATIVRPIAAVTTAPTTSPAATPAASPVATPTVKVATTASPVRTTAVIPPNKPAATPMATPIATVTATRTATPTATAAVAATPTTTSTLTPVATPITTPIPIPLRPVIREFEYRAGDGSCLAYWVTGARRASVAGIDRDLTLPRGCVAVVRQREERQYTISAFGDRPPPVSSVATVPGSVQVIRPLPPVSLVRLGSIAGVVAGPRGPIAGATIAIAPGAFASGTVTGKQGSFIVANVPAGAYRVTVSKPGYTAVTESCRVAGTNTDLGVIRLLPYVTNIK